LIGTKVSKNYHSYAVSYYSGQDCTHKRGLHQAENQHTEYGSDPIS